MLPHPSRLPGWLPLVALSIALVLLALHAWALLHNTDDLFINLRYAYHIGSGAGPVFTVGERVEGYTATLWVFALGGLSALGVDLLQSARFLAFLSGLLCLPLLWLVARCWHWEGAPLALLLLAANTSFAVWTASAMEMTAFTALLLLAVAVAGVRRWVALGVVLALATLMRPEGAMWALLIIGYLTISERRTERPQWWRGPLLALALWTVPSVLHVLLRLWYFGYPLPNTFYVKASLSLEVVQRGLLYLQQAALDYRWSLTPLLLVALLVPATWRRGSAMLWLLIAGHLAYASTIGGDWMAAYRFLVPVIPLVALQIGRAVHGLVPVARHPQRHALLSAVALTLALVNALLFRGWLSQDPFFTQPWVADGTEMAQIIKAHCAPGTSLAVFAAGALPYYLLPTPSPIVDMFGLTTAEIAHAEDAYLGAVMPGHGRFSAPTTRELRPDVYIFHAEFDDAPITDEQGWREGGLAHLIRQFTDDPAFWANHATRSIEVVPGRYFNVVQRHEADCIW